MRIWRILFEVLFILIMTILATNITDIPYGDFVTAVVGIVGMEIFGYCCENKKSINNIIPPKKRHDQIRTNPRIHPR